MLSLLFRTALCLYPAGFRERYEEEMVRDFHLRAGELGRTGGWLDSLVFRLRALAGVAPSAFRVRLEEARMKGGRRRMPSSGGSGNPGHGGPGHGVTGKERVAIVVGDISRDIRYALRTLVRTPVFAVAAVLTLALGIGLNAATFSVVSGLLLRSLDGAEDAHELVQLYRRWPGIVHGSTSIPHYQSLRDDTGDVFESVAAWFFAPMSVSSEDRNERLMGMMVSANFFQTYGVTPVLGRAFLPGVEDRGPGEHPVAILGHAYWQARFGGDPSIVGRTITVNGMPFQVVGVAPGEFKGPMKLVDTELYLPLMMQPRIQPGFNAINARDSNSMTAVARLREGTGLETAQAFLDAYLLRLREEYPDSYNGQLGTTMVLQNQAGIHPSFKDAQVGMSAVMMAVVALLLLIACVNVANLFLVRARERRREMGVRLSLGAGRRRIIQQLLTESVLFSLLSGLAGLGVARLALTVMGRFRPPMDGPFTMEFPLDSSVLLFTLGISVMAGLIFGLAPALQATNPNTVSAVKGEAAGGAGRSRVSSGLVVLQMALSILLLISSGLFLRSLQSATRMDPGFRDPAHLAMVSVDPGLQGYDEGRAREFFDRLVERVEALPGVTSVGMTNIVPMALSSSDRGVTVPGYEFAEGERRSLKYAYVTEGYLPTMGIRLVEGRGLDRSDDENGPPIIIVNKRFADRFWPGESALGKVVSTAGAERTVVGVVETGKYDSLGEEPTEFMYLPFRERFAFGMTLMARTQGSPTEVIGGIRSVVRDMDPQIPTFDVRTMEDHLGIALLPARLGGEVLGVFGLLGLLLAAVGVYGVMAYSVAQRTRELGIRVAVGADGASVLKLVLLEGLRLAGIGTVLGLLGAAGAAQLIQGLLLNVQALDPVAFLGVPAVLLSVATLAVYIPARKAALVDPMRALKTE